MHSSNALRNWGTGDSSYSDGWLKAKSMKIAAHTDFPAFFQRARASGSVSLALKPSEDDRRPSDLLFERFKKDVILLVGWR